MSAEPKRETPCRATLRQQQQRQGDDLNKNNDIMFSIPRFSTLSLGVAWTLGFVVALAAGVLADVFQGNTPTFPLAPTASLAVGLNSLCALLSILLGYSLWDSYSVYQPFAGGERYVLLQGCGWGLMVAASTLMVVYLHQLQPPSFSYGALTMLEGLAAAGNVFLVVSLWFFVPSKARRRGGGGMPPQSSNEAPRSPFLKSMLHSPNSESGLVVILLLSQMFLCNVGALWRSVSRPAMLIFTGFHVLNGTLIYSTIKWGHEMGFTLFRGPVEAVYLVLAWLLYLVAFAGGIALFLTNKEAPQVAFGLTALVTFVGVASMLVIVRTAQVKEHIIPLQSTVARYGRFALSATAAATACIVIGIMHYVQSQRSNYAQTVEGRAWINGLLLFQTLAVLFLLILSPMTHLAARAIYGEAFSFFQPFRGSRGFVFLQALGWTSFSASIVCVTFHMTATDFRWILFTTATGVMGQLFLQFSIAAFSSENPTAADPSENGKKETRVVDEGNRILNGELIVSLLLHLTSLILRLVVDTSAAQPEGNIPIPRDTLIGFASLTFVMSVPLAHFSGTDKGIPLFHPFQGSGTYVALQALGWSVYALFALKAFVVLFISVNGAGSLRLLPESIPVLWFTLEGVLQTVPLLLIILSVATESRVRSSRRRGHIAVEDAIAVIKTTLEKNVDTLDASQKAALQVALWTLAETSLAAHGVEFNRHSLCLCKNSEDATVAAAGEGELSASDSDEALPAFSTEAGTRHGAATLLVLMLCLASATSFMIAALWTSTVPIIGLVFTLTGFSVCTISCVSMHCIYGLVLHGHTGAYTFFMPFKGGSVFVALQISGWASYACVFIVTLMHTLEDAGNYITLPAGALFSVVSQLLILASVPKFNPRRTHRTYLEENGEGVVAMLVFLGAFSFSHLYLRAQDFFRHVGAADEEGDAVGNADAGASAALRRSKVPFFIIAMSMVATVPFVLITLNRSTKRWVKVAESPDSDIASDDEDGRWVRRKTVLATIAVRIAEIMMLLLGMVTPMTLAFFVYHMVHSQHSGVLRIVSYWFPLVLVAVALTLVISFVPHAMSDGLLVHVVRFRRCFVTFGVYSIATSCVFFTFGPVLIVPFYSVGAQNFLFTSIMLGVGGSYKQLRMLLRFNVHALLGYATYLEYLRVLDSSTTLAAFCTLWYYVVDALLLLWWLWYITLYNGKPEESGAQRSLGFLQWSEKYLFADTEKYFNLRIIVDDESVNMRDSKNQYIFSFHPHGVFPGTALFCPLTSSWKQKIGCNEKTHIVTHAASVVFNVPIVRDFNLRLGALAVGRSAIESNLSHGNSSLIVTGGQAELVLTKRSNTVMSLVTYHLGFVRLALKHRVPLVPIICFAENNVQDTIHLPSLQRATLKLLGFPFPIMPYGRWMLPLPHPTPLTVVVGAAVPMPPDARADNHNDVVALADTYFASVKELFYKYRAAAGYPNMELVLHKKNGKKEV